MKAKDVAMYVLGIFLVLGFFTLLGLLIFQEVPTQNNDILTIAIGALITGFATVVSYFYGSSAGSAAKNEMLKRKDEPKV